MDTAYIGEFAGGEHRFFLPMAQVIAAERESDASVFQVFDDLGSHLSGLGDQLVLSGPSPVRLRQCHAVIRNALIGGGTPEIEARKLIEVYCYPARPAIGDMGLAWNILKAAIYGIDQGSKKKPASTSGRTRSVKAT